MRFAVRSSTDSAPPAARHSPIDDTVAFASAAILIALGIAFFEQGRLVTGGTAGLALLVSYGLGLPFGAVFLLINLPFFALGWVKLGASFALRTGFAVVLVSAISALQRRWLAFDAVQPAWAAVTGGLLVGVGLLILFRHRCSLGGFNVLALWLQERRGWRAGWVQLGLDAIILLLSLRLVGAATVVLSMLGVTALNLTLAVNHRPGRYAAV
ncbi:MAG: YitT family protein [Burkholderiaceae bacterium]|nr:YitT family protein [Burkholderiaceae bacterium]